MNPNVTLSVRCFEEDHIFAAEGPPPTEWVFVGLLLTLVLGIFLGSGLIIATCMRMWKLISLSNYLILQLALSDFGVGCGLLYSALATIFRELDVDHNLCALRQAVFLFPGTASFIGLLVISCNRYMAIVHHPLTFQVTPSRIYYVMHTLIIWIPSAFLGFLLPMMWHNHCPPGCSFSLIMTTTFLKYAFMPFFIVLAFPMMALYARILFTAKKQLQSITDNACQPQETADQPQEHVYMKGQIKILKAVLLIFVTFYISWLPFLVIIQLYFGNIEKMSPMTMARYFALALIPVNSLANPLIYAYRLPDVKSELTTMLLNCRKRMLCHQIN